MPAGSAQTYFAITAPGLERIAAAELVTLGARPSVAPGGVTFRGPPYLFYEANLRLRTASRILLRLAEFHATAFHELERHAKRVPWERFASATRPVRLRVTCRKSRLYHSDAVAERVLTAIEQRVGTSGGVITADVKPGGGHSEASGAAFREEEDEEDASSGAQLFIQENAPPSPVQEDASPGAQLFIVRLLHDRCTISADSSGALLHRRGYRQATAKAPLRETLAAAMLLDSGWSPAAALIDPMCGSGTLPIEAAMIARRIPPGVARTFAFQSWPEFDAAVWREMVDRARAAVLPKAPSPILAVDRDAGAVAATSANAARVGGGDPALSAAGDLELGVAPISSLRAPPARGWVVTNPPYGVRVGERGPLRSLYARFGDVLRRECPGWGLALLSADRKLEAQLGIPLEERFQTRNGGIPVRFLTGLVGANGEAGKAR